MQFVWCAALARKSQLVCRTPHDETLLCGLHRKWKKWNKNPLTRPSLAGTFFFLFVIQFLSLRRIVCTQKRSPLLFGAQRQRDHRAVVALLVLLLCCVMTLKNSKFLLQLRCGIIPKKRVIIMNFYTLREINKVKKKILEMKVVNLVHVGCRGCW